MLLTPRGLAPPPTGNPESAPEQDTSIGTFCVTCQTLNFFKIYCLIRQIHQENF